VAEWFKAAVLKTAVGASPPWVRIPPHPPERIEKSSFSRFAPPSAGLLRREQTSIVGDRLGSIWQNRAKSPEQCCPNALRVRGSRPVFRPFQCDQTPPRSRHRFNGVWVWAGCRRSPLRERRHATISDRPDRAAINDELGAVDRGSAVRGEVGDKVGHLIGFGSAPYRNSAQCI
jgi:hypothetical protein